MATRIFGVDPGAPLAINSVREAVGPTATSAAIALVVDLAASVSDAGATRAPTREEVLLAIESLEAYLIKCNWPPA